MSLKQETAGSKRKLESANEKSEPSPKKNAVSPTEGRQLERSDEKSEPLTKESLQSPTEGRRDVSSRQRYNPMSVDWQRQACQHLGMQFVRANGSTPGGSDVPLPRPARCRTIEGDGNCLFRALSHAITGSERQHSRLRSATVEHMRSLTRSGLNQSLEANVLGLSVEEHLARTRMDQDGSWGTDVEVTAISHPLGVNIAMYDVQIDDYITCGPYLVDPQQRNDNTRPTIYVTFTGNHFNFVECQEQQ